VVVTGGAGMDVEFLGAAAEEEAIASTGAASGACTSWVRMRDYEWNHHVPVQQALLILKDQKEVDLP